MILPPVTAFSGATPLGITETLGTVAGIFAGETAGLAGVGVVGLAGADTAGLAGVGVVSLVGVLTLVCVQFGKWRQLLPKAARTSEEFFVGGRTVGPVSGGATLAATQVSAGTLVGTVGLHYLTGASFVLIWVGIWIGWLLSALLIGPQLRAFEGVTVPDFLADRFDVGYDGAAIRGVSALLIVVAYLVYTSAQYLAAGRVVEALLGVDPGVVMVVLAVLVLGYTATGGMRASIRTDVLQIVLLTGGAALAAVVGLGAVGGPTALYDGLVAIDPSLVGLGVAPVRLVGFAAAFGFGVMAAPNELSRMYTMRDSATVRRAIGVSIGIQAVIAVSIALLGLIARVRFPGLQTPDTAVVELAASLFGPVVSGLLVLGILAAVLSTVDSVLLVSASALAHDFYAESLPAFGLVESPGEESVLRASKAATVVAGTLPLVLALFPGPLGELVQLIVAFYASLIGGSLLVPILAGFHWDGATPGGALAGTLAGFGATVAWQLLVRRGPLSNDLAVVDPVVPGVVCNAAVLIVVSLARAHSSES